MCTDHGIRLTVMSPYHSRGNGQVERQNRTVQSLLRRMLFGCPPALRARLPQLLPSVQLALNTTTSRALGCPPYLLMFGCLPPSQAGSPPTPALAPESSASELASFTKNLEERVKLLQRVARKMHEDYRAKLLQSGVSPPALALGGLAVLYRPRASKLVVASSGPYLIIELKGSEVTL